MFAIPISTSATDVVIIANNPGYFRGTSSSPAPCLGIMIVLPIELVAPMRDNVFRVNLVR